jgi:uracil-DNA glycosylase
LTKCFPGSSLSGKGDRPPSAAEIKLCNIHIRNELELVQPEIILTLGRLSANYFVDRRPLDQLVGKRFSFGAATVIPLPHPSGVSHWLNSRENRALLDDAIQLLANERERIEY